MKNRVSLTIGVAQERKKEDLPQQGYEKGREVSKCPHYLRIQHLESILSKQTSTGEEFSCISQCRFMVPLLMGTHLTRTPTAYIMA